MTGLEGLIPSTKSQKDYIDLLTKENDRLSVDIRSLESMNERFLAAGLTVIGAGFAYGIDKREILIFYVLPFALFGLFYMTLDRLRSMMWLGGYKRAIEDKINEMAGETITAWETLVADYRGRSDIIIWSLTLFYGGVLFSATAYSARVIWSHRFSINGWLIEGIWLFAAVTGIMVVLLGLSMARRVGAYQIAYRKSKELLATPPDL